MTTETRPAIITEIERAIANIPRVNTIPDARKLLALAQGYVVTAHKLYRASEVNTINEANEDKGITFDMGRKAGELRLYAEARLGELIKQEQEAGRLAMSGRPNKGNNDVTFLEDYNLTKMESSRAQELAEHKEWQRRICIFPQADQMTKKVCQYWQRLIRSILENK